MSGRTAPRSSSTVLPDRVFEWRANWKGNVKALHLTDAESARKIVQSGFMQRGLDGCMSGLGINFTESPQIAGRKAWLGRTRPKGLIEAEVALGRCYEPQNRRDRFALPQDAVEGL